MNPPSGTTGGAGAGAGGGVAADQLLQFAHRMLFSCVSLELDVITRAGVREAKNQSAETAAMRVLPSSFAACT